MINGQVMHQVNKQTNKNRQTSCLFFYQFSLVATSFILSTIYIYIYKSKHTRQRLAVATQSFTPVGDLQATDISNLLHAHINKADL